MALRSIDNTLPEAIERPRKVAKIGSPSPSAKSKAAVVEEVNRDSCKNDENSLIEPPTAATEQSVEYVSSLDLEPLSDPETKIQDLLIELESKDWIRACGALNDVRRLALFHSSLLLQILEKVMAVIVKTMKNPRSALCKTSIMACTDVFSNLGEALLSSEKPNPAFDNLLLQLLLKASQDKKFVCEEAEKALGAMAASISPLPLLNKLHSFVTHSNFRVRAKAAVAISKCVPRMGREAMKEFGLATLLKMASQSLSDRLPEAREAARCVVHLVYGAFSTETESAKQDDDGAPGSSMEELWEGFCSSNLSKPMDAQSVVKVVFEKRA